jgi:hypothetical protein
LHAVVGSAPSDRRAASFASSCIQDRHPLFLITRLMDACGPPLRAVGRASYDYPTEQRPCVQH